MAARALIRSKLGRALVASTPPPMVLAYERALAAVEACAEIGEAAKIQASAAAIAHYAHRAKDKTLLVTASEIRLRASIKLGLLCLEIGRASVAGPGRHTLPAAGKSKHQVLVDAGVNPATAYAAEQLCGGRYPTDQKAALAAAEEAFAAAREKQQPLSLAKLRRAVRVAVGLPETPFRQRATPAPVEPPAMAGLRAAVATAVQDVTGAEPCKPAEPVAHVTFLGAVRRIGAADPDKLRRLAIRAGTHAETLQLEAQQAERALSIWIGALATIRTRLQPAAPDPAEDDPPVRVPAARRHAPVAAVAAA
jgi:hypothetical protein